MDKNEQTILAGIFNTRTITSAGGIILALVLSYTLYQVLTNDLSHLNESINRQADVQEKTNEILIKNAEAISGNTEILRVLNQRIK